MDTPDLILIVLLITAALALPAAGIYYRKYCQVSRQLSAALDQAYPLENRLSAAKSSSAEHSAQHDWLTREIHRRVKSNLQMISSLLSSQFVYLTSADAQEALRNIRRRIQAILLVHQKLDQSSIISSLDLCQYIRDLLDYLKEEYAGDRAIRFETDLIPVAINFDLAILLGLIVNEAVSNTLKFAFPGGEAGKLTVRLETYGGNSYKLTIADNGVGLPPDFNLHSGSSFGKSLIAGLSQQLEAKLLLESGDGVTLSLVFTNTQPQPPFYAA